MYLSLLALLATTIHAQDSDAPWHNDVQCRTLVKDVLYDCSSPNDLVHFTNFTLTPPVLKRGEKFEVHVQGRLKEPVSFGTKVHGKVYLGFVRIYKTEDDLCGLMKKVKHELQCPVAPTTVDYKYTDVVPWIPFGGSFKIEATGISQTMKQIFMLKAHIKIH